MSAEDKERVTVATARLEAARPYLEICHPFGFAKELVVQAIDIVGLEKAALLFATAVTELQREIDFGSARRRRYRS